MAGPAASSADVDCSTGAFVFRGPFTRVGAAVAGGAAVVGALDVAAAVAVGVSGVGTRCVSGACCGGCGGDVAGGSGAGGLICAFRHWKMWPSIFTRTSDLGGSVVGSVGTALLLLLFAVPSALGVSDSSKKHLKNQMFFRCFQMFFYDCYQKIDFLQSISKKNDFSDFQII